MGTYWNEQQVRISRKERRCVWCGEDILKKDKYIFQSGVMDSEWQNNHYHPECFEFLCKQDETEFCPYDNERPGVINETE